MEAWIAAFDDFHAVDITTVLRWRSSISTYHQCTFPRRYTKAVLQNEGNDIRGKFGTLVYACLCVCTQTPWSTKNGELRIRRVIGVMSVSWLWHQVKRFCKMLLLRNWENYKRELCIISYKCMWFYSFLNFKYW